MSTRGGFLNTGKGIWGLNEQVSGEVAWKPAHQLGDYSVGRGNGRWNMFGAGLGEQVRRDLGRLKKPGEDEGEGTAEAPEDERQMYAGSQPTAVEASAPPPTLSVTTPPTEVLQPTRTESFNDGYRLTDVRSGGGPRDVDPYDYNARFNFPQVSLPTPGQPLGLGGESQRALNPRRAAFSQGAGWDIEDAEVLSTSEIPRVPDMLELNPATRQRRKAGIGEAALGRIRSDLSQFRV